MGCHRAGLSSTTRRSDRKSRKKGRTASAVGADGVPRLMRRTAVCGCRLCGRAGSVWKRVTFFLSDGLLCGRRTLGLGLAFRRCGGSGRSGGCLFGRCGRRIVFRHIGRRSVVFAAFFDNGGRFLRLDFGRTQFGLGLAVAGSQRQRYRYQAGRSGGFRIAHVLSLGSMVSDGLPIIGRLKALFGFNGFARPARCPAAIAVFL